MNWCDFFFGRRRCCIFYFSVSIVHSDIPRSVLSPVIGFLPHGTLPYPPQGRPLTVCGGIGYHFRFGQGASCRRAALLGLHLTHPFLQLSCCFPSPGVFCKLLMEQSSCAWFWPTPTEAGPAPQGLGLSPLRERAMRHQLRIQQQPASSGKPSRLPRGALGMPSTDDGATGPPRPENGVPGHTHPQCARPPLPTE